jgi:peptidyl-dipeptidase A
METTGVSGELSIARGAPAPDPRLVITEAEQELLELGVEAERSSWVYMTYVNEDTRELSSLAYTRYLQASARWARRLAEFDARNLSEEESRKRQLLRVSRELWAPDDPHLAKELTLRIATMQSIYARGRFQPPGSAAPLDLQALERILAESRSPDLLRDVWVGWHRAARPVRPEFLRYVELANAGARTGGFADLGALWRSRYDMDPQDVERLVDGLWEQVEPLYRLLHAFVRLRLAETYGEAVVPRKGPIPAHLLGNMWAQTWEHIFPLLAPPGSPAPTGLDLTGALRARGYTPEQMVRTAEQFFVSLGLDPLPPSFWERSMLVRPRDREVVCHASAWDVDGDQDLRLKMCIEVDDEDFRVLHHELGHNYYQRAYRRQPYLFREGAHDGFHEAVGDTIALSITPEYLQQIGLAEGAPGPEFEIWGLLRRALERVAFLPFGLLIDRWRWRVFEGAIAADSLNRTWNEFRRKYQGVAPPVPRDEEDFDPGAKYHVVANVPYLRYFFAHLLQFQFHRALLRAAHWDGPLHRGSIYGSRDAGRRLATMLEMGARRPWPEALEAMTGERTMSASALREYFRPLEEWLTKQLRGSPVGW